MDKFKRGKPLNSQARQMVFNVYLYFLNEANVFKKDHDGYFKKVQERVTKSTGISRRTLTNILNEKRQNQSMKLSTPKKGKPKSRFRLGLDDFDYCVIRNMIYNFQLTLKELPTVNNLRNKLIEAINFKGCVETLRLILKDMGFKFLKTDTNRRLLMEKTDIRLKRIKYLREIQQLRNAGRNIVFMDESYVHTSHTKGKTWQDSSKKGIKQPISKGERIIIVHAGNEKGFVSGALMLHKCVDSEGDYHKEINAERYQTWLRNQLIPNLPPNSVLVIDNAPYHNKLSVKPPNSNTPKPQMIAWLQQHNVPHDPNKLKPELYKIIKSHKEQYTEFAIDRIMEEHGHKIVRLPPYHPDFNPIENIWAQIKQHVAKRNIAMNVTSVKEAILEKINNIGSEEWKKVRDHALKCEDEYRKYDPRIDSYSDEMIIYTGDSSDTSEIEDLDENSDDSMMSGIENLPDSD